jgi:acyl-CoA thioesterase
MGGCRNGVTKTSSAFGVQIYVFFLLFLCKLLNFVHIFNKTCTMHTLKEFLKNDRFAALAGARLTEVGEGTATVAMTVTAEHLNAGGVCQGGALFTMADLGFAAVANSHGHLTFSIESTMTFHKSALLGDQLLAVATETYDHHKLPCCQVKITNQKGELVASFSGIGYRKDTPLAFDGLQ